MTVVTLGNLSGLYAGFDIPAAGSSFTMQTFVAADCWAHPASYALSVPAHRAMLEAGARVPPRCVEAVHSRLPNAQAISDCSYSAHQGPRLQNSTLADLIF